MRMVTTMQAKHSFRKGCVMLAVHISINKGKDVKDAERFKRYPVLQQFQDVFLAEIPKFPPHREVGFSIELVPGVVPSSKAP